MQRHAVTAATVLIALGAILPGPAAGVTTSNERTPVATTPHFAFYSDFATNLNDALIAAGVARNHHKPELFQSGSEKDCFGNLPPSARAAWEGSVAYYAKIVSPKSWMDREQHLIRVDLAGFDEEIRSEEDRQFVAIAAGVRQAASPAYRTCRWAAQDTANRRWIEDLKPLLAAHEEAIGRRLEALYQKKWTGLPIPVDIVETVNWAGANSIIRHPAGGQLLISVSNEGLSALEVVFHEASHLLADRQDPLQQALDQAARDVGRRLPGDLWHVVLFYTTGEAVRKILNDSGTTGYTPMIYEIFGRSPWGRYKEALEKTWPAYLDGKRSLSEAATALMKALPEGGPPKGS